MIRFLFRLFGFVIFTAAFIAMIADGVRSIAADRLILTKLGETWSAISPASLIGAQTSVTSHLGPLVWDPLVVSLLLLPTFAVGFVLGLALMVIGKDRTAQLED
ncbi:hypothetical protein HDIA_0065 [Hartmannibacter diazotrophicus]|uniref:PetM family of cytochrome b6f complex subunit 7 n=1 Tax=Hartmannibacter diazotrophicus TaxID=1482074 RepID=A0A2C9D033_9HYPH|nr:hypothetical protein [Hartmannibacter diazotrophicus]SON53606.1 hypothetical protein HDIA_0065 [Hartmannibacter diazotrophicus]